MRELVMRYLNRDLSRRYFLKGIIFVVLGLVACTTYQPGKPEYSWLNGKLLGETPGWGTQVAHFEVVNENQIIGSLTFLLGKT